MEKSRKIVIWTPSKIIIWTLVLFLSQLFFYKCVFHNLKHVFIAIRSPFQRHLDHDPSIYSFWEKWLSFYRTRFLTPSKIHFLGSSSKFSVRGRYRDVHKNKLEFLDDIPDQVTFQEARSKKCKNRLQSTHVEYTMLYTCDIDNTAFFQSWLNY